MTTTATNTRTYVLEAIRTRTAADRAEYHGAQTDQTVRDRETLLATIKEQQARLDAVKAVEPIRHGLDHDARFANGYNAAIAGIRAATTATEGAE